MKRIATLLLLAALWAQAPQDRLAQHRNLGKAFYENPTTQLLAVDEFKKALDLAPQSPRERLNYGLALLRAGKTKEGIAEVERAQKQDPKIPHTWFNLGIAYKKDGEFQKGQQQLERMIQLVSDEPVSHYNLAVLLKLNGKPADALRHFETASKLDPNLAGPHFQLYNAYRQANRMDEAKRELAVFLEIKKRTAGAAVPEDMEWSYYSEIYELIEPRPDAQPAAELKFRDTALAAKVDPKSAGIVVIDRLGLGKLEVLAWSADGSAALPGVKGIVAIVPGDFNNDGLADLCVVTESGAALWVNQKGKFQKSPVTLPAGKFEKAVWIDHDHDYDLDLVLLGAQSALARNNGGAGFSDETKSFPFVKGHASDGTIFELIADTTGADLVVAYEDRTAVLYRDKLAGKYEAQTVDVIPTDTDALVAYDIDNDGWMDLASAGPRGVVIALNRDGRLTRALTLERARGPLVFADLENRGMGDLIAGGVVYRNQGMGRLPQAKSPLPAAVAMASADLDGDGRADVVLATGDGVVHRFANQTVTKNSWTRVELAGVKNLKLAPGAEVEVKAGAHYQKKFYDGTPLGFGLPAGYREIDTIRITWPNGLIQNEPKQLAGKPLAFKEAQRLSGSCPMIFTWNGKEFEFISDVLGVAPLGAASGDGTYFPVDHDEYVQIPGESLQAVDGKYEIRVTEELREVSYLDQIRLIAVDHPAAVEIFTNDKFKAPPFPEFRLYGATRRVYPLGDDRLRRRDRVYAADFQRNYAGVAGMHHQDLDFSGAARDGRAVLILNGWVDWADGSTFLGASQESKDGLVFPYLQVKDGAGKWRTVLEDMGIPAGKPKTIAVDLSGKWLSASREVRIVTNLCVYWDEIFLSEETAPPEARITPIDASNAELRFRGFSKPVIHPERAQPEWFRYSDWMPTSMWNPTPGMYTRYGDVRQLITGLDDRLAIMGSGDELRLLFPAALPPLPSGWRRDFLLFVDGWAKDGDANTAYSQTVKPLPFHGMRQYGDPYPDNAMQRDHTTRPALRLLGPLTRRTRP